MVQVELRYRDFTDDKSKSKFSILKFTGNLKMCQALEALESMFILKKDTELKKEKEDLLKTRAIFLKQIESLNQKIEYIKSQNVFFSIFSKDYSKVKELRRRIKSLNVECSKINENINYVDMEISNWIHRKKHIQIELLDNLKFTCKSSNYSTDISVEIYESTLSDEELFQKAKEIYFQERQKQENERNDKNIKRHRREIVK